MKKILTLLLLGVGFGASAQNLGIRTTSPNATLDVVGDPTIAATPDGILLPRVSLTELAAKTAYGTNQIGAVVYVNDITGTANAATNAITKVGYYRFMGTKWLPMLPKFAGAHAVSTINPTLMAGETKKITFTGKDIDANNWFDLASGKFKPTVAGYYQVSLSARVNDGNVGTRSVQLFKNDVLEAIGNTAAVNSLAVGLNYVVYLNGIDDYLDARLYSAEALTVSGSATTINYFQANLIGQ